MKVTVAFFPPTPAAYRSRPPPATVPSYQPEGTGLLDKRAMVPACSLARRYEMRR